MAGASVILVESSDRAFTAAFSGQLALDLDERQYQDGFGPCLEVAQSAGTVTVPDMTADPLAGIRTPSPRCRRALPPCRWPCLSRKLLSAH
jgi:hypothetical protein